jgi:hypothetical protein
VVDRIQVAIEEEGWVCNVMPRGFIKSTLSENAALWALLYGKRRYVLFFAGTASLAEKGISSVLAELVTNDLLLEDFPEACIPFRALEGRGSRSMSQTYKGKLTNLITKKDTLRLPMIPGFEGSGGIMEGYGLLAPPRGARFKNEDGENVRPDVAICDDPSTDDSAKSDSQNQSRMRYLKNSISMMGGHGKELSLIINATIIADGDLADQLSDPDISPEVQAVRVKMVKKMPKALDSHWLKEYANLRRNYDRNDPRGRIKAKEASTEYLRENYDLMHAGSSVAWENIGLELTEISALQHAMNILIDKGPDTFYAECQNEPLRPTGIAGLELDKTVADRVSGFDHRTVPNDTAFLVFGMDVHNELLYYTVSAITQDFTGRIVDYGTWPEQKASGFTLRSAKYPLSKHYGQSKGEDTERAIELGVEDLLDKLYNQGWKTANGDSITMSGGAVDVGYKPTEVKNAIRRMMPTAKTVICTKGVGIKATTRPMREWDLKPKKVIRVGPDRDDPRWVIPTDGRDGDIYQVLFDANFWKSATAARLLQSAPTGRWELYGEGGAQHDHYVSHLIAEQVSQVSANGRTVDEWTLKSGRDNHWWDSLVMCAVAASVAGAQLPVTRNLVPEQVNIATPAVQAPKIEQPQDDDFSFFHGTREDDRY